MAETLALAAGVPLALAAAWWASQRSWSPAAADQRGIALQTVIVIVVMLVIAGGVAAVLLARGGDVVSDLEAEGTDETACQSLTTGDKIWTYDASAKTCKSAQGKLQNQNECHAAARTLGVAPAPGQWTGSGATTTCTITFPST